MTTIQLSPAKVIYMAEEGLAGIVAYRELAVEELIDDAMKDTRWGVFTKAPRFDSREAALDYLKNDNRDFFGSLYSQTLIMGYETKARLLNLKRMAQAGKEMTVDMADYNALTAYLDYAPKVAA